MSTDLSASLGGDTLGAALELGESRTLKKLVPTRSSRRKSVLSLSRAAPEVSDPTPAPAPDLSIANGVMGAETPGRWGEVVRSYGEARAAEGICVSNSSSLDRDIEVSCLLLSAILFQTPEVVSCRVQGQDNDSVYQASNAQTAKILARMSSLMTSISTVSGSTSPPEESLLGAGNYYPLADQTAWGMKKKKKSVSFSSFASTVVPNDRVPGSSHDMTATVGVFIDLQEQFSILQRHMLTLTETFELGSFSEFKTHIAAYMGAVTKALHAADADTGSSADRDFDLISLLHSVHRGNSESLQSVCAALLNRVRTAVRGHMGGSTGERAGDSWGLLINGLTDLTVTPSSVSTAPTEPRTILQYQLSWRLTCLIRYHLRYLLDSEPEDLTTASPFNSKVKRNSDKKPGESGGRRSEIVKYLSLNQLLEGERGPLGGSGVRKGGRTAAAPSAIEELVITPKPSSGTDGLGIEKSARSKANTSAVPGAAPAVLDPTTANKSLSVLVTTALGQIYDLLHAYVLHTAVNNTSSDTSEHIHSEIHRVLSDSSQHDLLSAWAASTLSSSETQAARRGVMAKVVLGAEAARLFLKHVFANEHIRASFNTDGDGAHWREVMLHSSRLRQHHWEDDMHLSLLADLSTLTSFLQADWFGGASMVSTEEADPSRVGRDVISKCFGVVAEVSKIVPDPAAGKKAGAAGLTRKALGNITNTAKSASASGLTTGVVVEQKKGAEGEDESAEFNGSMRANTSTGKPMMTATTAAFTDISSDAASHIHNQLFRESVVTVYPTIKMV